MSVREALNLTHTKQLLSCFFAGSRHGNFIASLFHVSCLHRNFHFPNDFVASRETCCFESMQTCQRSDTAKKKFQFSGRAAETGGLVSSSKWWCCAPPPHYSSAGPPLPDRGPDMIVDFALSVLVFFFKGQCTAILAAHFNFRLESRNRSGTWQQHPFVVTGNGTYLQRSSGKVIVCCEMVVVGRSFSCNRLQRKSTKLSQKQIQFSSSLNRLLTAVQDLTGEHHRLYNSFQIC